MLSRLELMIQEAREQKLPETFTKDLEVLRRHAARIGGIAQNLLSFAKKSGAERIPVDLNEVVRGTIALVEHDFKKNNISFDLHLAPSLPKVSANFNQLQQVLLNLLTNARDALANGSPAGQFTGPLSRKSSPCSSGGSSPAQKPQDVQAVHKPQVVIGTWPADGKKMVRLCVTDNGPAIAKEHLSRLFDPFFTTKPNGTGLGLSVSYGIIKEHGGDLKIGNDGERRGCGTCFMVTLPVLNGEIPPVVSEVEP